MFNQDEKWDESSNYIIYIRKLLIADGVIIASPEHNQQSQLPKICSWMTFLTEVHPFGSASHDCGYFLLTKITLIPTVHLQWILDAPGVNAYTLPEIIPSQ